MENTKKINSRSFWSMMMKHCWLCDLTSCWQVSYLGAIEALNDVLGHYLKKPAKRGVKSGMGKLIYFFFRNFPWFRRTKFTFLFTSYLGVLMNKSSHSNTFRLQHTMLYQIPVGSFGPTWTHPSKIFAEFFFPATSQPASSKIFSSPSPKFQILISNFHSSNFPPTLRPIALKLHHRR